MSIFSKLANGAIVGLIIANFVGIGLFLALRPRVGLYRLHSSFPALCGYLPNAAQVQPSTAPCDLIRLSADGCPYCRADRPLYRQLLARARQSQCEAVVIAPKVGELKWNPAPGGPIHLQYVAMDLGRALVPYAVPQTILLGSKHRIAWYQVGAMNRRSLKTALGILARLAAPQG